jgi:hypothetical protein
MIASEEIVQIRNVICLLLCAGVLLAYSPSNAFAQTPMRPALASGRLNTGESQEKPKPDLRAAFADVTTKMRSDKTTAADLKRLDGTQLNPQNSSKGQSSSSRAEKIILIAGVAAIIVTAVVLAFTLKKQQHTFCDIDPGDPDCL